MIFLYSTTFWSYAEHARYISFVQTLSSYDMVAARHNMWYTFKTIIKSQKYDTLLSLQTFYIGIGWKFIQFT